MSNRYQLIEDDEEPYEPVRPQQTSTRPAEQPSASSSSSFATQQQHSSGGQHVSVVVPQNWQPGQQLQIPTESGTHVVDVPAGMAPGQQFRVQLPDANAKLSVTVPEGMSPGDQITVRAPNGQLFKAPIPAGYGPGNTFYMAVPASATQPAYGGQASGQYAQAPGNYGQQPPQHQQSMAPDPAQMNAHAKECAVSMKETAGLLEMMLGGLEPGEDASKNELIEELVQTCRTSVKQSERYVQDITDEAALMSLLESNDAVCSALTRYESVILAGPQPQAPQPAAPAPAPSVSDELAGILGDNSNAPPAWAAASIMQSADKPTPSVRDLAPEPAAVPAWGATSAQPQQAVMQPIMQSQQPMMIPQQAAMQVGMQATMQPPPAQQQPPAHMQATMQPPAPAQQQPPAHMQATMQPPAPAPMPPPTWAASQTASTQNTAQAPGMLPPLQTAPTPAPAAMMIPTQAPTPAPAAMMIPTQAPPPAEAPAPPSEAVQRAAATEQKLDGDVNDILADFDSLMSEIDNTNLADPKANK